MSEAHKSITKFGGCDLVLRSEKDKRVLGELLAIEWQEGTYPESEERWARQGQFTIDEVIQPPLSERVKIEIHLMTEGPTRRIEFEHVHAHIVPSEQQEGKPTLMHFDAHLVRYSDYIDGHWQLALF